MALLAELQAVTDYYYERMPTDIYFESNVLLYKMLPGPTADGGRKIAIPLEYDELNAGPFGAGSTLPMNKKEILTMAYFPYSAYYGQMTYDLDDTIQNSGDAAIVKIVNAKLKNCAKSLRNKMGTQIYNLRTANTGPQGETNVGLTGLGDLFNTTTSTAYGDIKEDDLAVWKANVITTSESISFSVLQKIRRTASINQNDEGKPNLYITTELLKDSFENSLQTQQRFAEKDLVNAGFRNILFDGAPVVPDDKQTAGYCDALNLRYLDIYTHSKFNFTQPKWHNAGISGKPETYVAYIEWAGNLVCKNRKAHCRHTGLSAAS